jgi:hypothetical protein
MPVAHDAAPWVRPPLGGHETSWRYGVARDGPGPQMELSFADLIDILNPLQHIPLLSSFYRALTGDQIEPAAQIMGATLYGGPVGLLAATNLALIQEVAGESSPDMLAAALIGANRPDGPEKSSPVDGAQSADARGTR